MRGRLCGMEPCRAVRVLGAHWAALHARWGGLTTGCLTALSALDLQGGCTAAIRRARRHIRALPELEVRRTRRQWVEGGHCTCNCIADVPADSGRNPRARARVGGCGWRDGDGGD